MKSFWDHSGKPSVFVVKDNDKEIYRGPFEGGMKLLNQEFSPASETDKLITDWIQGLTKELPNFVYIARLMEQERDKYREALMKIEEIFVDGEDTFEDRRAMGEIAQTALEGEK